MIQWWPKAPAIMDFDDTIRARRVATFATHEECDEFTHALTAHGGAFIYKLCYCSLCFRARKKLKRGGIKLAYGEFIAWTKKLP